MADVPTQSTTESPSIGTYYKILGIVILVGFLVLVIVKGVATDVYGIAEYVVVALLFVIVIRPNFADELFKTIIDKLPFTKYVKGGQ